MQQGFAELDDPELAVAGSRIPDEMSADVEIKLSGAEYRELVKLIEPASAQAQQENATLNRQCWEITGEPSRFAPPEDRYEEWQALQEQIAERARLIKACSAFLS